MAGAFQRVKQRQLVTPRGAMPYFRERLQCGHWTTRVATGEVVLFTKKNGAPPKKWVKGRERLCRYCLHDLQPQNQTVPEDREVIWTESYDLLTDIARAVYDAEQKDVRDAGRDVVDGRSGGGVG